MGITGQPQAHPATACTAQHWRLSRDCISMSYALNSLVTEHDIDIASRRLVLSVDAALKG